MPPPSDRSKRDPRGGANRKPSGRKPPAGRGGKPGGRSGGGSGGPSKGSNRDRKPHERYDRGRRDDEVDPRTKTWGRVARRGAAHLNDAGASKAFRDAVEEQTGEPWEPESWVDEGPVRADGEAAVTRARSEGAKGKASETVPDTKALKRSLPANRREHAERDVKKATKAFQREYFRDAEKLLKPLIAVAPDDLTVLELYGLTLYRLERWRAAAERLERFAELTGSVEQHPVIADCRRALGHHKRVAELWDELREQQGSAALMAEGRIVYAGDLADRGDLKGAIAELERSSYKAKKPKDHHLRLRYALADLYERAGDVPRARELFASIAAADPDYVDVRRRIAALR